MSELASLRRFISSPRKGGLRWGWNINLFAVVSPIAALATILKFPGLQGILSSLD
jgi:hypothetical protein